jgi:hypothetical protein
MVRLANGPVTLTHTRELLAASPTAIPFGIAEVAATIDASLDCLQACTSCGDAELAEQDVKAMATCIALCVDCADVCDATARVLSRPAHWDHLVVHRTLKACVRECTRCAEECDRHAHHRHCAICAKVCRACEAACSALLDAEAFEELQKLAGA